MQKTYATLMILFTVFVSSSVVYLIVGFALSRTGWEPLLSDHGTLRILLGVFSVLSLVMVAIAARMKGTVFLARTPPENQEDLQKHIISRSILSFAFCEVPAIFGLVLFFLSGNFSSLMVFCIFSLLTFFWMKPSREKVEEQFRRFFPEAQ